MFATFFAVPARAQFFAESSYKLLHGECPQSSPVDSSRIDEGKQLAICSNGKSELARMNLLRKNIGEVSERAHIASLAEGRSRSLACTQDQLMDLQKHPDRMKEFISDFSAKLTLLGHEKRIINELRNKATKSKAELTEYERAVQRAQVILESLPFAQVKPIRKIISYVISQYDLYAPDRIEGWLPKQTEKLLRDAVPESIAYVRKNKAVMDEGVATMADSLDDEARESLAQDTDLVESFRQDHLSVKKEIEPAACRVDAKYGKGAQYRDGTLLAVSIIGTGMAAGLVKLGAIGLASSVTGAAAAGSISIRSAGILRILATAGGTAASLTQTHKACFSQDTDLSAVNSASSSSQTCETNILKSQGSENCLLVSALNTLGIYSTAKSVKDALGQIKTGSAVSQSVVASTGVKLSTKKDDVTDLEQGANGKWRVSPPKALEYAGKGITPEVPKALATQYPKLQSKLENIGVTLRNYEKDGYPSPNAKKEMLERMAANSKDVSAKDKEGIRSVIDALHDNTAWAEFAKQLTLDAATWINKSGSAVEKAALFETGEISRRSMLVILAKRAADRGETIGKLTDNNEKKFFEQVRKGPFVDKGVNYASEHGQLSHFIQMDYIAPQLEKVYGKGSREFYKTVTENNDWTYLFDLREYHMGSPLGITSILGKVLPLANPK